MISRNFISILRTLPQVLKTKRGQYILLKLHEGEFGNHLGHRSIANQAFTLGFYWPTIRKDAKQFMKRCNPCQRFASSTQQHADLFHPYFYPVAIHEMRNVYCGAATAGNQSESLSFGVDRLFH